MNGCVHGSVLNTLKSRKKGPLSPYVYCPCYTDPTLKQSDMYGERNFVESYCNDADYSFEPITENDKD